MDNTVYWFRRKRSGLGWGPPCSWQGWAFFIPWFAAVVWNTLHFMPQQPVAFTIGLALLTVILLAVCAIKGEPLQK